jgi:hypothetical protein
MVCTVAGSPIGGTVTRWPHPSADTDTLAGTAVRTVTTAAHELTGRTSTVALSLAYPDSSGDEDDTRKAYRHLTTCADG